MRERDRQAPIGPGYSFGRLIGNMFLYGTPLILSVVVGLLLIKNIYDGRRIDKQLENAKIRSAYVQGALAGVCLAKELKDEECAAALTDEMGMWLQTELNMSKLGE